MKQAKIQILKNQRDVEEKILNFESLIIIQKKIILIIKLRDQRKFY